MLQNFVTFGGSYLASSVKGVDLFWLRIVRYREGGLSRTRVGNTEEGKCRLTNDYPFFLFLIGHGYYEKNILYL
jgi:hypothetical protein